MLDAPWPPKGDRNVARRPKIEVVVGMRWNGDIIVRVEEPQPQPTAKIRLVAITIVCLVILSGTVTVYAMVTGNNLVLNNMAHEAYNLGKILYKLLRLVG